MSSRSRPLSTKAPPQPSWRRDEPPPGCSCSPKLGPPTTAPPSMSHCLSQHAREALQRGHAPTAPAPERKQA
eukprot:537545-Prorocentrum_minimum.AAC.1